MPLVSEPSEITAQNFWPRSNRLMTMFWTTLYAHMRAATSDQSVELQIRLNRTLVALAADGVTDPAELRRKAMETMALRG